MIRFIAHFDGQKLSPDEPVNLPTGTPLQVTVEEVPTKADQSEAPTATFDLGRWFQEIEAECGLMDGPEDFSVNHDQYIASEKPLGELDNGR